MSRIPLLCLDQRAAATFRSTPAHDHLCSCSRGVCFSEYFYDLAPCTRNPVAQRQYHWRASHWFDMVIAIHEGLRVPAQIALYAHAYFQTCHQTVQEIPQWSKAGKMKEKIVGIH